MVEILCISSEIGLVLLLLSIAWDGSSTTVRKPEEHSDEGVAPDTAIALHQSERLFLQCLHLSNHLHQESPSDWQVWHQGRMQAISEELFPLRPSQWKDRLTGLPNRAHFDELCLWFGDPNFDASSSTIVLFDIDQLKMFNDEHGMDAGDSLIRECSKGLLKELLGCATLHRFEAGRFIAVFPSLPIQKGIVKISEIREQLSTRNFDVKGEPLDATLSASAIQWDANDPLDKVLEQLNEGLFRAKSQGRNRGFWKSEEGWMPMIVKTNPSKPIEDVLVAIPPSKPLTPASIQSPSVIAQEAELSESQKGSAEAGESSDSASSDDIEALFESMRNSGKQGTQVGSTAPQSTSSSASIAEPAAALEQAPPEASKPKGVEEVSESASSDDIEALFESMRNSGKQGTQQGSIAPQSTSSSASIAEPAADLEQAPPEASKPKGAEEASESASSDDIEALFASVREAGKQASKVARPQDDVSELLSSIEKIGS